MHNNIFYICCLPFNNNVWQLLMIVCYIMFDDVFITIIKIYAK